MDWIKKGVEVAQQVLTFFGLEAGHLLGILLALVICWGSTQALKILFGLDGRKVTLLAFAIAALVSFTVSPPEGLVWNWTNLWMSIAAGLAAPFAYKWLKAYAERKEWALAKAMAADEAKRRLSGED